MNDLEVKNESSVISIIEKLSLTPGVNMDALERLLALKEKEDAKQARRAFYEDLARFQVSCPDIVKSKQGHGYKYADISMIVDAIKKPLFECNLSFRFEQEEQGDEIQVHFILTHIEGHSERTSMKGKLDGTKMMNALQTKAACVQYLRRYTMTGGLGIVTTDEDNDAATKQEVVTPEQAAKIESLLVESKADRAAFLKWLGVASVPEIKALRFDPAVAQLELKKAKLK